LPGTHGRYNQVAEYTILMLVKSGHLIHKVSLKVTVQFGSLYTSLQVKVKRLKFNN